MWARLPRGCICTNRLRVGAEFIKPMLMIPFIVQNLNAIGQTDEGAIAPSVISMLLGLLAAIGKTLIQNPHPEGWGDQERFSPPARAGGLTFGKPLARLHPDSPPLQGTGFDRSIKTGFPLNSGVKSGDLRGPSVSVFRIPVQLCRINLLVAPWLPPSLWARGIFLCFPLFNLDNWGPINLFPFVFLYQQIPRSSLDLLAVAEVKGGFLPLFLPISPA